MEIIYLSIIFYLLITSCVLTYKLRKIKKVPKLILCKLQDVKPNDTITITWFSKKVNVECRFNNHVEKKILLKIRFVREDKTEYDENRVYHYNDPIFKDFSTLNYFVKSNKSLKDKLEEELITAVSHERFNEAAIIRDTIKKLPIKS